MFSFKGAKEWASGFLNDGGGSTQRPNLEEFLNEVSTENTEHLYFTRKVDEKFAMQETKPTYEQLSQSSITSEALRNIKVLKAFEVILQERCVECHASGRALKLAIYLSNLLLYRFPLTFTPTECKHMTAF